ncbi:MAG: hypothetical protein J6N46_07060 [Bacteroidales bacterium]|nr:hypothetical protein [Bacteroidales bacterium]
MATYLISKEEFVTLYKYGSLHVRKTSCSNEPNMESDIDTLLSQSDVFEYAQERLFLTADGESSEVLEMTSVTGIYPLDSISKRVLEGEFNGKIVFNDPVFEDKVKRFLTEGTGRYKALKGIKALFGIFGIQEEPEEEIVNEILKGLSFRRQWKYYDIPLDRRSPWSMLIAYDRYRNYPNNGATGYFFDMIDAFLYGAFPREDLLGFDEDIVRDLSGSVYKELEILRGERFRDVASKISSREDLKINASIEKTYGSAFLPALFFLVKDRIRKGGDELTVENIAFLRYVGKEYPELFPRLLTLIGGFFGYSWVYDRYYEALGMPFVKNRLELKPLQEEAAETETEEAKPVEDEEKTETGQKPADEPVEESPTEPADAQDEKEEAPVVSDSPDADEPKQEGAENPEDEAAIPAEESPKKMEEAVVPEEKPGPVTGSASDVKELEEKKEETAPEDFAEPEEESAPEIVEPAEEKAEDIVQHQPSVQDDDEETIEDVFGARLSFTEFATEVYKRSISSIRKNKSLREKRFAESLARESTRMELLDIVRSGQSFQLAGMKNKLDPEFSPTQWDNFKTEIMTFNKR